jgi:hypothetical protein
MNERSGQRSLWHFVSLPGQKLIHVAPVRSGGLTTSETALCGTSKRTIWDRPHFQRELRAFALRDICLGCFDSLTERSTAAALRVGLSSRAAV